MTKRVRSYPWYVNALALVFIVAPLVILSGVAWIIDRAIKLLRRKSSK